MLNEFKEEMNSFVTEALGPPRNYTIELRTGDPAKVISTEAERSNAELIVISTRGQSRLHYALIGKVSNNILHMANIDVLVVPASCEISKVSDSTIIN